MDIDEFLDRELSDLDLQTDGAKKEASELPEFKEQIGSYPLFENIRVNLSKGNLEQAEQSYVQLWHIMTQQKLKWNKELYEQLSILTRQFSSALNSAYADLKRKAEHINELISRAKSSLREGKKEAPFKFYAELQGICNSIPSVFFEEKKVIEEQIVEFYKELKNVTDSELMKRVSALIQEISGLINKIDNSIRAGDMINAIVSYNECIELYNQVPEGFLRYKNLFGMRLLDIYKSLSIYTEISSLQKQLGQQHIQQPARQMPRTQQIQHPTLAAPPQAKAQQASAAAKSMMLNAKKESAKKNIEKGFYNEASKDIQEVLQLEPRDAEAKVIHAKIKTLQ